MNPKLEQHLGQYRVVSKVDEIDCADSLAAQGDARRLRHGQAGTHRILVATVRDYERYDRELGSVRG